MAGTVDAACMIDGNLLLFTREGILNPDSVQVVGKTPLYDHCTMTAGPSASPALVEELRGLLLGMSYGDSRLRPLLDLEGLKEWRAPRVSGYAQLERAVDAASFYDATGGISASQYRP
jgi:ABC-type phosphate/phosphonate transport system substrate-binding protein